MSTAQRLSAESSPTAHDPGDFAGYEHILAGYRHQDFPDLSSRRFAPDALRSVSQALELNAALNASEALATVTVAIGRVLGAYCGCADVLLAIADDREEKLRPVRVVWGEGQTWQRAVGGVTQAFADPAWPKLSLATLRSALDLTQKQSPCLALLSAHPLPFPRLGETIPLVITVDRDNAAVSITASERSCHPLQSKLIAAQVDALVAHAQANPQAPVAHLPKLSSDLLSAYDKHSFEECSNIYERVPPVKLATDHLLLRAAQQPEDIAVRWYADLSTDAPGNSYVPETITYVELDRKANQMARWLREIGVERGTSVAVCMKRDIWFHIAFIGILRAGGCYVPIDAELPVERQQFIAKDSSARHILSTSDLACFEALGDIAIDIKGPSVQDAIREQSADEIAIPEPHDISYILYTSGTTGTPKGCILTHRGLSEAIWALSAICASVELEDPSQGNYLSIASVAFDVHLAEILVPLALGIPILSAPRSLLLEDLPYYITNLRVSHVGIVPSLIEATMGAVQEDEDSGHATSLRYIASGGEKMSDAILDKWASHPRVRLANFYGPSEVTIGCAARIMDKDTPRANIGHTFANVAAYVVDENMNILLRGATGELVVEGPLVGRGYVGRPDLTQKVFLKFPDDGTERWAYRTGDLVRMMPDATLEIIGRIDTQIKLRGVRIESEGISSILRNAAAPKHSLDAMTILAKHPSIGTDQLVSFIAWDSSVPVATRKEGKPTLATPPKGLLQRLRSACDRELASYMRPSHIIPLSFIPLSSNGKADAKVLAAFFLGLDLETLTQLMADGRSSISDKRDDRQEPTEVERKVLDAMRPYVKMSINHLGPQTNIFECGMDSLAIARLAADLRKALDVPISPAQIMQRPAVSEIASVLKRHAVEPSKASGASPIDDFAASVREEVEGVYPSDSIETLLPPFAVQEGVLYRSANSPSMYVQHVILRLAPDTSVPDIQDVWKELVAHHEMLRTVFHFGSNLVQVVLRSQGVQWHFAEKEAGVDGDDDLQRYFTDEEASSIARELNLGISTVPPVRLSFVGTPASGATYMVLSIHHALYDGISLPVLLRDLERAYLKKQQLPSASLRAVLEPIALVDHGAAREFWTGYLKGFPWERLLKKTASSREADVTSLTFSRSLSELQAKAAAQHVTLQALLMCAYGYLLGQRLYGHDDVVFGVIRAGRSLPVNDIDTTICPMITVLPARVRYSEPGRVLQTVQRDIARSGDFEHIPLSRIQKWISESEGSLFDTLFSVSFKESHDSALWRLVESQNPEPDYILAVEVVLDPSQDQAIVHAAFTSADISPMLVDGILRHLEETAVRMADSNDWGLPISETGASRHWLPSASEGGDRDEELGQPSGAEVDPDLVFKIRDIASQFLRIDHNLIFDDTSLLSLGLDSIKSVGLSRKFSTAGLTLSSADIMRFSTPRRLALHVQQTKASSTNGEDRLKLSFNAECNKLASAIDPNTVKLSDDDVVMVFPTTTLQAGMLSQTVSSNGRLYVHLFPLRLDESVDSDRLRQAWQRAVTLFDILRTSFHFLPGPGIWAQVVHSTPVLHWSETVRNVGSSLAETLNPFLNVADESEYFREPPIFLNLLKATAPEVSDHLVLVLHHALYDGLSIAQLLHAVKELYDDVEINPPTPYHELLPHLLWQEKNGTDFWVERLRGLHGNPIPRRPSATPSTAVHRASLEVKLSEEDIRRACRSAEVTPQCLGQTAFAKLLASMTHSTNVVFGRVVSGRDVPGAEDAIGPMLNTLPCRVTLSKGTTNKSVLRQVHVENVAGMAWQHASLRSIQRRLGVGNLWESIFVFQPKQEGLDSQANRLWTFDAGDTEDINIQYPLNVELHETTNGYVVQAACTSDVADAEGLYSLIEQYASFLDGLVRFPDDPWTSDLPEGLTEPANDTESPAPVDGEGAQEWDPQYDAFRGLVSEVSKIPASKIYASTPLAALGIDSITAVQLVAKARRIGVRFTSSDVVQSRTVGELLGKLREAEYPKAYGVAKSVSFDVSRAHWPRLLAQSSPGAIDAVERIIHATPGMEWMIGMWQRSEGSRFQHVFGYRLPPDVDSVKLHAAWNELIHRHAVLRSTFVYDHEAAAPRVVIFKADVLSSHWSQEALVHSEEAVVQRMKQLVSQPPSIVRPITRAVLLQSPSSSYLLIHLHHFQYDAWSLQLLVDDLRRLYLGEEPRSSNELDGFLHHVTPTVAEAKAQERYWESVFATTEEPSLFPALCHAPAAQERIVHTDQAAAGDAAALEKRARESAVSLQSVFLACWAQVQSKYAGSDSATFSLWHSGRTGEVRDIERLAVPCINVLPYRVSGVQALDTLALAKRIQEDLQARSASVEQTRLVKVHEWTGIPEKPLSNVFVNIVKVAPDVEKTADRLFEPIEAPYYIPQVTPEAAAGIDRMRITELIQDDVMIDILVMEKTDKVVMSIESAAAVMDSDKAKSLIEEWGSLVKACLA
ncbi:hypothetical protein BV20DRAFT_961134 [Pilatotrama ljubarskyi]|nr:hypothetical protein BV20DRAFT_961134 [Pilatotrama ljubarskyi]